MQSRLEVCLYLVRKKEVNFILSCYTNLSHTGQEKFTSFFRMFYINELTFIEFLLTLFVGQSVIQINSRVGPRKNAALKIPELSTDQSIKLTHMR